MTNEPIFSVEELQELEALEVRGGRADQVDSTQDGCINSAAGCGAGVPQTACENKVEGCGSVIVSHIGCAQTGCHKDPNSTPSCGGTGQNI